MKFIYRKVLFLGLLSTPLIFNFPATAQERLIDLGTTKQGDAIFLNTKNIRGTRFAISMLYGSGMMRRHYKASCGESRLFRKKVELISSNGIVVDEDKTEKELKYKSTTAAGKAMKIVCQRVGARGW
ncbi:MAG: hypothetical protein KI793_07905 [Rivularia sp. (in: Bacteria)]|nr:hypothetical protein [Rivularia sp. MS3]